MTRDRMSKLKVGDVVRHMSDRFSVFVVTANYGTRVTAVKTVDLTNPSEWFIVSEVVERKGHE